MTRLLITGAAGNMGRLLRPRLRRAGRVLRLLDVVPVPSDNDPDDEVVLADLTDANAVAAACKGVDAILHLGGISVEAPFDDIVEVNIRGTANVLEGARAEGVQRVVLASSNHAVGFYRRSDAPDGELPDDLPPRPDTYYGWSKAAIESLGALYHERFGIDVIALRIGTCFPQPPPGARSLSTWLSPDDAARLVEACLSAPRPGFRLVWGISNNTRRWWSLAGGRSLGYQPVDDAETLRGDEPDADLSQPDNDLVGGPFCAIPLGEWLR
jgi:nucleoside-diphosphate-sugar epimerase